MRPNQSGMHTCGFCSQRRQDGCWDRVGLYPADYGRDATTEGGRQAFAATRPAARGGMQGAESQFRNGWRATLILQDSTVEIHEIKHDGVYGTMTASAFPMPRERFCLGASTSRSTSRSVRYSRLRLLPTVTFIEVEAPSRSRAFSVEIALPPVRTVTDLNGRVTESEAVRRTIGPVRRVARMKLDPCGVADPLRSGS